jgi:carbon storage regulator CsrA
MAEKGLLVLARKKGETIELADGEIVLTIVGISGAKVRVSICAPKDINIMRGEIANKKRKQVEDVAA